jgi:hypothetical protein
LLVFDIAADGDRIGRYFIAELEKRPAVKYSLDKSKLLQRLAAIVSGGRNAILLGLADSIDPNPRDLQARRFRRAVCFSRLACP